LFRELVNSGVLMVAGFTLVTAMGTFSASKSRRSASIAPSTACLPAL